MKKYIASVASIATFFALALSGGANAASGTFKDGGYLSTSTDSGTCGNDWANDSYTRKFIVTLPANNDGSYNVTERFVNGHFRTIAGTSPGACQAGPDNGNTVKGGVKGTFSGYYHLVVNNGTLNTNGSCNLDAGQCKTDGWVTGFFGGSATWTLGNNPGDWGFKYHSRSKVLTQRNWTNSAAGNSGDITWS